MTLHQLEQTFRRVSHLQHVSAILQWDEAVMMASAGGDERARAMATLGSVVHEHLTASEVTDWLASAEADSGNLDQLQRANLREMKRIVRSVRVHCRASLSKPALVHKCSANKLGACSAQTTIGRALRRC